MSQGFRFGDFEVELTNVPEGVEFVCFDTRVEYEEALANPALKGLVRETGVVSWKTGVVVTFDVDFSESIFEFDCMLWQIAKSALQQMESAGRAGQFPPYLADQLKDFRCPAHLYSNEVY